MADFFEPENVWGRFPMVTYNGESDPIVLLFAGMCWHHQFVWKKSRFKVTPLYPPIVGGRSPLNPWKVHPTIPKRSQRIARFMSPLEPNPCPSLFLQGKRSRFLLRKNTSIGFPLESHLFVMAVWFQSLMSLLIHLKPYPNKFASQVFRGIMG